MTTRRHSVAHRRGHAAFNPLDPFVKFWADTRVTAASRVAAASRCWQVVVRARRKSIQSPDTGTPFCMPNSVKLLCSSVDALRRAKRQTFKLRGWCGGSEFAPRPLLACSWANANRLPAYAASSEALPTPKLSRTSEPKEAV